jgi:hypothetical protein
VRASGGVRGGGVLWLRGLLMLCLATDC